MYSPNPFFMLRTPIFPINFFIDYLNNKEDILTFLPKKNYYEILKEAILLSSKSLYDTLILYEHNKIQDIRKLDQIRSGVLKYFSRATSRATPYGYFAAVKMEYYFDESVSNSNCEYQFKKSIRPDMEWIQSFVKRIEENIDLVPEIKLKMNPIIFEHGDRILLAYSSVNILQLKENKNAINENISIKNNSLINFIRKNLQEELKLIELVNRIKVKFSINEDFKINSLLQDLVNKSFIITELKPIIGKTDIFSEIIEKLSFFPSQKQNYEYLSDLKFKMNEYSKIKIGAGVFH
ncbi:hypothetical protein GCL57_11415 [Fluviispira multicolorata]|uniref:Lantibiotic dehydratase N-terminal domain-containing protein n=1 Tax=Fluviispira multicolorata TaxID=2654512 RepID=A0A833JDZ9_9BACT|nr:hypothetical protein GCL57_11415 [Fluviispira multicolorata]